MMMVEEHGAYQKCAMARGLAQSPVLQKVFAKLRDEEQFHAQVLESELPKLEKK